MSDAAVIQGSIVAGPAGCTDTATFPGGISNVPALAFNPPQKGYNVSTGLQSPNVNSPSSFQTLSGIGTGQTVTQASMLYLRTTTPVLVEVTMNGVDGGTAQVLSVSGLLVLEPGPSNYITAVAVQGQGQVEYMAVGLQ